MRLAGRGGSVYGFVDVALDVIALSEGESGEVEHQDGGAPEGDVEGAVDEDDGCGPKHSGAYRVEAECPGNGANGGGVGLVGGSPPGAGHWNEESGEDGEHQP